MKLRLGCTQRTAALRQSRHFAVEENSKPFTAGRDAQTCRSSRDRVGNCTGGEPLCEGLMYRRKFLRTVPGATPPAASASARTPRHRCENLDV